MEELQISLESVGNFSDKIESLTITEPIEEDYKKGWRFWMSFVTIMVTTFISSLELVCRIVCRVVLLNNCYSN